MGGKGAQPQNNQMVQFEKEQAAKAERKEAERKLRLETGMKNINEIFQGKPIMGTKAAKLDLTALQGLNPTASSAAPTGDIIHTGNPAGVISTSARGDVGDTGWKWGTLAGGGEQGYGLYDPTGALRSIGASWEQTVSDLGSREGALDYMKPYETGEYAADAPFGEKFKAPYKKGLEDLHKQNLNKTYNDALDEAIFAHSRAGTRASSTYADTLGDIGGSSYEDVKDAAGKITGRKETPYGQYGQARAGIVSDVDSAMSKLSDQINSAQDSAEAQLYMTEDPEKAANEARKLAGQIPVVPQYNALGDMFKPLVIGATGFYQGYQGQQDFNRAFSPKSSLDAGTGKITR